MTISFRSTRATLLRTGLLALATFGFAHTASADGDPQAGKEKAQACVACHGEDGNSQNPIWPRLAGQWPDYIVQALEDYQSGARNNAVMAGFAANLSDEDREDLAAWYASQEPKVFTIAR